ncbi:MAG TPA: ABC transporter ATP-binding protein [Acidimicrobiales bacterium]|nr:ABC transporter ATP-binding protein [Acidimicrobiales bacterium]
MRSRPRGPEASLLWSMLRPERRATAVVLSVLVVALFLRLGMPALLGRFVDEAIGGGTLDTLVRIALAYVVAALVAEGLQLAVMWGSVQLSWRAGNRLRERLARHAVRLEMAWHGRHSPGQLIERIDGDVEALVVFFTNVVVHVLGNLVLMLAMLAVAFVIDPTAGLLLLVTAAAGGFVLVRLRSAAVPAREAEREANAILYGDLEERLGGLEDLRANGAGPYAVHRLHLNSSRSWHAARRASLLGDGSYSMAAATFATGSVATLALGFLLHRRGAMTVGQVLALFRYSEMLRQPLEAIAEQIKEFQKAIAGARRASGLLATEPAIADGTEELAGDGPIGVRFDRVAFGYGGDAGPLALHDLDLEIPAGTHLGVVGRTGSGKTTMGRLVLRLWDVTSGRVLLDGVDVRDLQLSSLRHRVAVVTQDVELFRATLRDNLTLFGARSVDDEHLVAVLERVGLGTWLAAQPGGLDVELHGGQSVSAGEAQLLAFARAFLADPAVVILDEASSRLDPLTEAHITAAMHDLLDGRTAIIVAHRLATLDEVDAIAVVDAGKVVEHGPRAALAADPSSRFARLLRVSGHGLLADADEVA